MAGVDPVDYHGSRFVRRARVLVVGYRRPGGGLARLARSVLRALATTVECHLLGIDHHGDVLRDAGIVVHPCRKDPSYGITALASLADALDPNVVVLLNDLPIVAGYLDVLKGRARARLYACVPYDGLEIPSEALRGLDALDRLAIPTHWGAAEIRGMALRASSTLPPMTVIPHELDASFLPLHADESQQRRSARAQLWPDCPEILDSFIVFNGNTDTPRKCLDTTLWAFAEFAAARPRARLYLHWVRPDSPLRGLARRLGIDDRLLPAPQFPSNAAISDSELNLIYNACDAGLNTSTGEGWGMVSVEHAATGAAQIVPRHSAAAELWEGAAECVDPPQRAGQRCVMPSSSFASPLCRLHDDAAHRARVAKACMARARQYEWSPDIVAAQWRALIETPRPRGIAELARDPSDSIISRKETR